MLQLETLKTFQTAEHERGAFTDHGCRLPVRRQRHAISSPRNPTRSEQAKKRADKYSSGATGALQLGCKARTRDIAGNFPAELGRHP